MKIRPYAPIIGNTYRSQRGYYYKCIGANRGCFTFRSKAGYIFYAEKISIDKQQCLIFGKSRGGYGDNLFTWKI